jgi:hypothetical protein
MSLFKVRQIALAVGQVSENQFTSELGSAKRFINIPFSKGLRAGICSKICGLCDSVLLVVAG